jgi:signal transduction histidine kinase
MTVEAGSGPFPVLADPALIQQLVANLVINARDAMAQGGGRLEVGLRRLGSRAADPRLPEEVRSGAWLELRVSDEGCGMTPEVRARAFEPFFTTKEGEAGTGLGLSQVYGIVRQHDGHIVLSSRPGEGTTVTIVLPEFPGG